jgi:hypothetical protein
MSEDSSGRLQDEPSGRGATMDDWKPTMQRLQAIDQSDLNLRDKVLTLKAIVQTSTNASEPSETTQSSPTNHSHPAERVWAFQWLLGKLRSPDAIGKE